MIKIILLIALLPGILYQTFLLFVTWRTIRKNSDCRSPQQSLSGISILKPLKGLDDQLEQNLESFFTLDYPEYELIFGISDSSDPALPVVMKMCEKYPEIASKIVIDAKRIGLNPKINNLHNIYREATHPFILISDSNVRVTQNYLRDLIANVHHNRVGMVTSLIKGTHASTLGALFENIHLNTFIAGSVLLAEKLFQLPISIGKSMLIRRDVLEKIGGFAAFHNVLAEDHMISTAIQQAGYQVKMSVTTINNVNVQTTIRRFISRHARWAKMRRHINLGAYLGEGLTHITALSLLAWSLNMSITNGVIFFSIIVYKVVSDFILTKIIGSDTKWYHIGIIPFKDVLIFCIWIYALFSSRINWRGHKLKISSNTTLIPLTSKV